MPGSHITDMRDFDLPCTEAELPAQAARLRHFLGNVVQAATATLHWESITGLPCQRRPRNRRCLGSIAVRKADLPEPFVFWECTACADSGRIAGFLGGSYDLSAFAKRGSECEQTRDVALTVEEYRSWISGDMIPYDSESMQIIYSAAASKRGIVVSVPESALEMLRDSTAADANHESNRKRQAGVYSIFDKLNQLLEKPKTRSSGRSRDRHTRISPRTAGRHREADSAYAHGFFSAIVAGPTVMPTRWLQRFLSPKHASVEALNANSQRVMNAYNEVAEQLLQRRHRFGDATLEIARRDAQGNTLVDWHLGFLDAMDLSPDEWTALLSSFKRKDILSPLAMISQCSEDPSKRGWLRDQTLRENIGRSLGVMTARLWEAYRGEPSMQMEFEDAAQRRDEPKVSRNAPCPCGSAKKYKRCCGSTLRAV